MDDERAGHSADTPSPWRPVHEEQPTEKAERDEHDGQPLQPGHHRQDTGQPSRDAATRSRAGQCDRDAEGEEAFHELDRRRDQDDEPAERTAARQWLEQVQRHQREAAGEDQVDDDERHQPPDQLARVRRRPECHPAVTVRVEHPRGPQQNDERMAVARRVEPVGGQPAQLGHRQVAPEGDAQQEAGTPRQPDVGRDLGIERGLRLHRRLGFDLRDRHGEAPSVSSGRRPGRCRRRHRGTCVRAQLPPRSAHRKPGTEQNSSRGPIPAE